MRMDKYKDESMPNFHALVFPLCPPCPEFGHEEHKDLHKGHEENSIEPPWPSCFLCVLRVLNLVTKSTKICTKGTDGLPKIWLFCIAKTNPVWSISFSPLTWYYLPG